MDEEMQEAPMSEKSGDIPLDFRPIRVKQTFSQFSTKHGLHRRLLPGVVSQKQFT
jgi:hypothetical protein